MAPNAPVPERDATAFRSKIGVAATERPDPPDERADVMIICGDVRGPEILTGRRASEHPPSEPVGDQAKFFSGLVQPPGAGQARNSAANDDGLVRRHDRSGLKPASACFLQRGR